MFRVLFTLLAVWSSAVSLSVAADPSASGPAPAQAVYLPAGAIDLQTVLPPPPRLDSPAGRADLETVLQVQAARTPAQETWAKEAEEDTLFRYASAVGAWFTPENLPQTAAFFAKVDADVAGLGLKKIFGRPRPPFADDRVKPCVVVRVSPSYPSGHALRAWVWAGLLGEIYPEAKVALAERARWVSWGRVLGGAHFPSDVTGGRVLAEAVLAAMLKNPAVQAELAKCRAEAEKFRLKKAA